MRSDVFHAILVSDPEVLLRSDAGNASDEDRAALVSALLTACENREWIDRDWGIRRQYGRLQHPGLAEQLKPFIVDATKDRDTRRVAIHIAAECSERSVATDLVAVALDPATHIDTRVTAAYAVIDLGDEESKRQLAPLVTTPASVDPNAELKGCGLKATWPQHLSSQDLLDALEPPPESFFGAYRSFLGTDPFQFLLPSDLPIALKWAVRHATRQRVDYEIRRLIDTAVHSAWTHLDDPMVLAGLVELMQDQLQRGRPIVERVKSRTFCRFLQGRGQAQAAA